eukprot:CAMPEP_0184683108 /NCGR_PEP_ID=MMETSP0312-20130426/9975_1 /TAXON_ID=31354 /ORGANISM="Compsopogon coeruleus, Strain SAG 36.94" /LENGTH=443 /DNA_ID=CAMNT_0027135197 /DNA_START=134 /DNA_END=1465 /DNA_ORIENTATION=-
MEPTGADELLDGYENLLMLLQSYHSSMLQAFIDAETLANELDRLLPRTDKSSFVRGFHEMQGTLRSMAYHLLNERFIEKTQEPVRNRIEEFRKLEHLDALRKRLWSRYQEDSERMRTLSREENLSVSQRSKRLGLIVEDEQRIYRQCGSYIVQEQERLRTSGVEVIEPVLSTLTLLQSQMYTLGCDLVSKVLKHNPDTRLHQSQRVVRDQHEEFETKMNFMLTHEIDLDDASVKEIAKPSSVERSPTVEMPSTDENEAPIDDSVVSTDEKAAPTGEQEVSPVSELARKFSVADAVRSLELTKKPSDGGKLSELSEPSPEIDETTHVPVASSPQPLTDETLQRNLDDQVLERDLTGVPENNTMQETEEDSKNKFEKQVPIPIRTMQAMFSFSPVEDIELELQKGDRIELFRLSEDGWWEGKSARTGKVGLLPSIYLCHTENESV